MKLLWKHARVNSTWYASPELGDLSRVESAMLRSNIRCLRVRKNWGIHTFTMSNDISGTPSHYMKFSDLITDSEAWWFFQRFRHASFKGATLAEIVFGNRDVLHDGLA